MSASEKVSAVYCGPFDAEIVGVGHVIHAGDEIDVTPEQLASGHFRAITPEPTPAPAPPAPAKPADAKPADAKTSEENS